MATPGGSQYITVNSRVMAELSGDLPVYFPDGVFRENFKTQLLTQGFNVEAFEIKSDWGLSSRAWRGVLTFTTMSAGTAANVIAKIRSAAEAAGSYTPAVTIPSIGQVSQPALPKGAVGTAIDQVATAVGTAAKNVSEAPKDLFHGINMIVVGIVVLAALIAFGPNIKEIARSAR